MPDDKYDRMALDFQKRLAESKREKPGFIGSFKRGASQFGADILGMSPAGQRPSIMSDPRQAFPSQTASEAMREQAIARTGIPEPTNALERFGERLGRDLPMFAVTAATGGLAASATEATAGLGALHFTRYVASEAAQDAAAMFAEQLAEEAGAGPVGQFAAGATVNMLMPDFAIDRVQKGRSGRNLPSASGRAAQRLSGAVKEVFSPDDVAAFAKRQGISYPSALEALDVLYRKIPIDPATGYRDVDAMLKGVYEARDIFPDPNLRPIVPAQVGEAGGQAYASMTRSMTRELDGTFGPASTGRARAVAEDLQKQLDSLTPYGTSDLLFAGSAKLDEQLRGSMNRTWQDVPFDQHPDVSFRGAKRAVARAFNTKADNLDAPPWVSWVRDQYGDDISLEEFQAIKSRIGYYAHEASQRGDRDMARKAGEALSALQKEVEALEEVGSAEYRKAIRETKEYYALYRADSSFVSALERGERGDQLVRAILSPRSLKSSEEAQIALDIAKRQPGGEANFHAMLITDLFGGDEIGEKTVKIMKSKLRKHEKAYRVALGDEKVDRIFDIYRKLEVAKFMDFGGVSEARRTGSNVVNARDLLSSLAGVPAAMADPTGAAGAVVVRSIMDKVLLRKADVDGVITELLLDDDAYERLIKIPKKPSEAVEWQSNLDKLLSRARARRFALIRTSSRAMSSRGGASIPLTQSDYGAMNREEQRNDQNSIVAPFGAGASGGVR